MWFQYEWLVSNLLPYFESVMCLVISQTTQRWSQPVYHYPIWFSTLLRRLVWDGEYTSQVSHQLLWGNRFSLSVPPDILMISWTNLLFFPSPDEIDVGGNFLLYLCAMKSRFMRICCIEDKLYLRIIFSLRLNRQVTKQYGSSSKLYPLWWRKRRRKKKRQRRSGEVATVLMVVTKIIYLFNWFLTFNFYNYIKVCCSQEIILYSKLFTTFL